MEKSGLGGQLRSGFEGLAGLAAEIVLARAIPISTITTRIWKIRFFNILVSFSEA
jgi:hypothetical protein